MCFILSINFLELSPQLHFNLVDKLFTMFMMCLYNCTFSLILKRDHSSTLFWKMLCGKFTKSEIPFSIQVLWRTSSPRNLVEYAKLPTICLFRRLNHDKKCENFALHKPLLVLRIYPLAVLTLIVLSEFSCWNVVSWSFRASAYLALKILALFANLMNIWRWKVTKKISCNQIHELIQGWFWNMLKDFLSKLISK